MRARRLQDIAVDTYLMEAVQILQYIKDKNGANKKLESLLTAFLKINHYVSGIRMEREGYDMAIDEANKYARARDPKIQELEQKVEDLELRIKFYEQT